MSAGVHAGADCSITTVNVNFAVYDPALSVPDDSTGTVTVTCAYVAPGATPVSYTITMSNGLHASTPATRSMAAGTARLPYNVYHDAGRTQVWGTGTGGTVVASGSFTVGPGTGNRTRTRTHTVYGRIPGLQDAIPGTYNDTLVLTLNY